MVVNLFGYQQDWINDRSIAKVFCKSRQTGITFAETLDIVQTLATHPNQYWYYLSLNEDRSKQAIEYAQKHCLVMGAAVRSRTQFFKDTSLLRRSIYFPNKSQLHGLPCNATTARGVTGSVTLDEFAHIKDAAAVWTALAPATTWGYPIRILTTPNGKQGQYYKIWTDNERKTVEEIEAALKDGGRIKGDVWSRHWCDVYKANAQGHPANIDHLRALCGDDSIWAQEYCCEFLDEGLAWLPYDLITSCSSPEATMELPDDMGRYHRLVGGYDVARKRDLSVMWINQVDGDKAIQRACVAMARSKFDAQQTYIDDMMPRLSKLCIDETGIGAQISETTVDRWKSAAEGVSMTGSTPAKIASIVKQSFERQLIQIADNYDIRRDLHSVRLTHTPLGSVSFQAPRGKEGHADRFWALGLALMAQRGLPAEMADHERVPQRRFRGSRNWSQAW